MKRLHGRCKALPGCQRRPPHSAVPRCPPPRLRARLVPCTPMHSTQQSVDSTATCQRALDSLLLPWRRRPAPGPAAPRRPRQRCPWLSRAAACWWAGPRASRCCVACTPALCPDLATARRWLWAWPAPAAPPRWLTLRWGRWGPPPRAGAAAAAASPASACLRAPPRLPNTRLVPAALLPPLPGAAQDQPLLDVAALGQHGGARAGARRVWEDAARHAGMAAAATHGAWCIGQASGLRLPCHAG